MEKTNLTPSKRNISSEIMHSSIHSFTQSMEVGQVSLTNGDEMKGSNEEWRKTNALMDCKLAEIMSQSVKYSGNHRVVIFLAPNVPLLHQQYDLIKLHTKLKVAKCSLDKDVRTWDVETWYRTVSKNQVLVMTPKTFLNALRNAFLVTDSVCLIFLDQCNHGTGNNSCKDILKEFYLNCQKLKLCRITASPAIGEGRLSPTKDNDELISEPKGPLRSEITKECSSNLEEVFSSAKEICKFYNSAATSNTDMEAQLEYLWSKYDTFFSHLRTSCSDKDVDEKYYTIQKKLYSDLEKILRCLKALGLICAYEAVKTFIENAAEIKEEYGAYDKTSLHKLFLLEVLSSIGKWLREDTEELLADGFDSLQDAAMGYISPKILELFKIFKVFWGEPKDKKVSCLILVEECVTAKVIVRIMNQATNLSHLTVASTVSRLSADALPLEVKKETTEAFLSGKINVLITTYVAEGISVPDKSMLIRFDQPKTMHNNFQSHNLLHGKDFLCITMLERGNIQQRECFSNFIKREYSVEETAMHTTSISTSLAAADGLDLLSPSSQGSFDENPLMNSKGFTSGAGTTKRKELHGMTRVRALSAKWGDGQDGITFHAYHIHFSCNIAEEHYSNFLLLLKSKLDVDVGNVEVDLYLISKFIKASISSHGLLHLNMDQIKKIKCFHTFLFNGIFGKVIVRSSDKSRFLIQTEESLWGESDTMYLIAPLDEIDDHTNESWRTDWVGINSCVYALNFLKENACLNSDADRLCNLVNRSHGASSNVTDSRSSDIIHLSNKSVSRNNIKDIVVVSIHTGRVYSIVDVVDKSANSTFDGYSEGNSSTYRTFVEYFSEQYGITLQWPEQPLFLLKQSHNAHNLLTDFRNEGESLENNSGNDNQVKPLEYIHMPPELLVGLDVRLEVVKSCYLIPSVMHRLESLMLASQLRNVLLCDGIHLPMSSSLILEALTTQRCNESFSLERLELLGDSVLKYAISCYLFLKHPRKHEGQLSDCRTMDVCNSNLHQLGIKQNLQAYIRDSPFDPRRWKAPGQRCVRPVPCKHGVDSQEVPMDSKFFTENTKVKVGVWCDKGHRWMVSKTISDCVEALVGACFIGGGLDTALQFMKWLGLNVQIEASLIEESIKTASLHSCRPKAADIKVLELKLGYKFSVKGLLLEALTHGTNNELDVSYQRLEFLGDSALDLLITRYLYQNHKYLDPGDLTDLRSACVSNANFGHASLRHKFYRHLQHSSENIHCQISEFVKLVSESSSMMKPLQDMRVPKVLGDLMESIAGAILIDSMFNLDELWRIFIRILSPIVTPDKLELPPLRELIELCSSLGFILKDNCVRKGDSVHAELKVQLEDISLDGKGNGNSKKVAKGTAALSLLRKMEGRGISLAKVRNQEIGRVNISSIDDGTSELLVAKKQKIEFHDAGGHPTDDFFPNSDISAKNGVAVIGPIESRKGGPRQSLHDLCKQQLWPLPTFKSTEYKSRSPIEILCGNEMKTGFSSFESQITLIMPGYGVMEATGEQRLDKKSSFDTAAMVALEELERRGKVIIATG